MDQTATIFGEPSSEFNSPPSTSRDHKPS
jgi:hypothetical protein